MVVGDAGVTLAEPSWPLAAPACLSPTVRFRPENSEATVQMATERGMGILAGFAACASAVLHNGLGRYDAARDAARRAFERPQLALGLVVAELAEAAARSGDVAAVRAAVDWLSERPG
jgi:aryl-alcohol dehydrogenase-like predicted oxidoreductase